METDIFWDIIGKYNEQTIAYQIILLFLIFFSLILSYLRKVKWLAKFILGVANIFISFVFFYFYGTQPIQKFFAFPLFLICGLLFLLECFTNKEDFLKKPTIFQKILLFLYLLYPGISIALGRKFPKIITLVMPCPIASLSIVVYSGYSKKNPILISFLTLWGLTGVKAIFFDAFEDVILFICGLYGVFLLFNDRKNSHKND